VVGIIQVELELYKEVSGGDKLYRFSMQNQRERYLDTDLINRRNDGGIW